MKEQEKKTVQTQTAPVTTIPVPESARIPKFCVVMNGAKYDEDFPNHTFPRPTQFSQFCTNEVAADNVIANAKKKYGCGGEYFEVLINHAWVVAKQTEMRKSAEVDKATADTVSKLFDAMVVNRSKNITFDKACELFLYYVNNVYLPGVNKDAFCILASKINAVISVADTLAHDAALIPLDFSMSDIAPTIVNKKQYEQKVAALESARKEASKKTPEKKPSSPKVKPSSQKKKGK